MGRVIKFRAWYEGSYGSEPLLFVTENINEGQALLEQFTGLLDKNGKEIYEGDIVALTGWDKMKDGSTFTIRVVWFEQIAGFVVMNLKNNGIPTSMKTLTVDGEVIGNIHENPELL